MTLPKDIKKSGFTLSSLTMVIVVSLCVTMIGVTGYVKYQLDQSENRLAEPDVAFSPDQELYEKTVLALGYSGFLGATQNFTTTRDRAALGDMRMYYKTAQEAIHRLGNNAPTSARRDMNAIMKIFEALLDKAQETDAVENRITSLDMLTAAASISTLDARMRSALASNRSNAHGEVKAWSMGLMFIAWTSLVLLACFSVMYFKRRDNEAEPLHALLQCIDTMARGNLETPIWGTERSDIVGDLARALDSTRLYFKTIPDLTVESDDGAQHFKFDGEARTIFQSLIQNITDNFDRAQKSSLNFTGALETQKTMLSSMTAHMKHVIDQMQRQNISQEEGTTRLTESLIRTAESLANVHKENHEKLTSLVPYMQERAQNMAEITQLAGRQVTQSLQAIIKSEGALRTNANQSQKVVQQLTEATNQMGERMFAGLNLMQASGKLLNETISSVKSRFNEAVATLDIGESQLQEIITRTETRLNSAASAEENMMSIAARAETSAEKMERAVNNICERHEGLSEQVVTATHRMESIVASFDVAQRAMSDATTQVKRDGNLINSLLMELRSNNDQLLASLYKNSETNFSSVQTLAEKSHALMQRLEMQIGQQAQAAEAKIEEITSHGKIMAQQATSTSSTLSQTIASLKAEQEKMAQVRGSFTETIADMGTRFDQHATSTFGKTEQWAAQSFSKLTGIAEQVESVMQRLGMLGQLTGTLGAVAGQLGQLVPTLTQFNTGDLASLSNRAVNVDMEETNALIVNQTEAVLSKLQGQWHEAVIQIEAMHDQLAQIVIQQKDQLETRLVVMDKKLRDATDTMKEMNEDSYDTEEKQAGIMNEIISAITKINKHVIELDDVIDEAGLKKEA